MNPWSDSEAYAREAAKVESAGEAVLLTLMWWRRAGWTVVTQQPISVFRIDLFVPEAGVAIEVDSFGGHGSNEAMERDARKRNLVVGRGWAPLTFSAKQAMFSPHDALADIMAAIGARMGVKPRPVASLPRPKPGSVELAAGFRGILTALDGGPPEDARLLRKRQEFAGRDERERLGVDLFKIVLDYPALAQDAAVMAALGSIEGPIADAAAALARCAQDGQIDAERFLRECPALLYGVAVECLTMPAGTRRFPLAQERVTDILVALGKGGA